MAERHTSGGQLFGLHPRAVHVASGVTRTALLPSRPYHYRDPAREDQVLALLAGIPSDLLDEPDLGPSYEWYREAAYEASDSAPVPAAAPQPEPAAAWCGTCGYQTSAVGHKITCGTQAGETCA